MRFLVFSASGSAKLAYCCGQLRKIDSLSLQTCLIPQRRAVSTAPKQKMVMLGGRSLLAVVVPVYACSKADQVHLLGALDALSRQTRQPDYLVLVDDGSPLPIPSIIRQAVSLLSSLLSACVMCNPIRLQPCSTSVRFAAPSPAQAVQWKPVAGLQAEWIRVVRICRCFRSRSNSTYCHEV